jgi:hypothetical protein
LDKINREYNTLRDGLNAISQVILIWTLISVHWVYISFLYISCDISPIDACVRVEETS